MRLRTGSAAFIALAVVMASCSDSGLVGPRSSGAPQYATLAAAALPTVRISELHYDNGGTDSGEAIEISGPAGTDLTGWKLYLYNGSNSLVYSPTFTLSGVIPVVCEGRGVVVQAYAVNGIQNGAPDAVALVNPAGAVVEFLSYEGVITALDGPALGMTSTDIGVLETGSEPTGLSLQRTAAGTWTGPIANTFGACNDGSGEPEPPAVIASVTVSPDAATIAQDATQQFTASARDADGQPIAGATFTWSTDASDVASVSASGVATGLTPGEARIIATAPNGVAGTATLNVTAPTGPPAVRFSEIHYDNAGADINEAIEIEGPAGTDLTGWSVVLYNLTGGATYSTRALTGRIPAQCEGRGVITLAYPADGIQNGPQDGFTLVNASGAVVEFLSYEGVLTATNGPAAGMTSTDIGVSEASSSPTGHSLQRDANGAWAAAALATIGACNGGGEPPPPPANSITFSGRTPGDPALPVGFQDQVFATLRSAAGTTIPTTFTWSSETPSIARIDEDGVMTALASGVATLRATAADGTSGTYSLPTRVATSSTTAMYEGNTEFGEPTDANASDDFIIRRAQYTASYNRVRGIPNWVSYDLDATHFGAEDRCDCFTFDSQLPSSFTSYTTADYTGAGTFHGYGIDRGHLARSFDRTAGSLDNATTFYFSNIIPQAADLNQGPWAAMENDLGELARSQNREVYIITGASGSKGTVKDEGKITIPGSVWKVAVIMPRDQGLEDIDELSDFEVIAVIMPNDPGVRNIAWETYKTTVDAVEALSGYDLLALLRDDFEIAAESGTLPPQAAIDGPYTSTEGSAVPMSAAGSTDPDGDALTYAWTFGDGGVASGAAVSHTYAQNGSYTVRLIVSDIRGLADTVTTTATIANVAPTIAPAAPATIDIGQSYTGTGSFTDPGADSFTGTVSYGDGSPTTALAISGHGFSLSHTYDAPGSYTITVRISDGIATTTHTRSVTVLSAAQVIELTIAQIGQLADAGKLPPGYATSMANRLAALSAQLERGSNMVPVTMQLSAMSSQLEALVRANQISTADAATVRAAITRITRAAGA